MLPAQPSKAAVFEILANQRKEDGHSLITNNDIAKCAEVSKEMHVTLQQNLLHRRTIDRNNQDTEIMMQLDSRLIPEEINALHGYRLFAEGSFEKTTSLDELDFLFAQFNDNCDSDLKLINAQDAQIKQQKSDFYNVYKAKLNNDQQQRFESSVYQAEFSDYCKAMGEFDNNSYALIHPRQVVELRRKLLIVEYVNAVQQRNQKIELKDIPIIKEQIDRFNDEFGFAFEHSHFPAQNQSYKMSIIFHGSYSFLNDLEQLSRCSSSRQLYTQFLALRNELQEQSNYYALKKTCSLTTISEFFHTASFVFLKNNSG